MKILETLMYIYQYTYYRMIEWDKYMWRGYSKAVKAWMIPTDIKPPIFWSVTLMMVAMSLDFFITEIILHRPFYFPSHPIIFIVAYILAVNYLNNLLLGPESRTEHYRNIFETWDKRKHIRWTFCLILYAVLSLAACFFAGMESDKMYHSSGEP